MTEFHNPKQELRRFHYRVFVAAMFVVACFALLGVRFYYLQVIKYDYYHSRAEGNRIALLPIVPNRGIISDRNGVPLARNYSVYTLEINPARVENLEKTIDQLAKIVRIDSSDRRRFKKQLEATKYFDSVPIRSHLTEEDVARLVTQRYRFPGVEVQVRLFRDYPYGGLTAHIVGYIGRINENDMERIETRNETANYRGSEYIGKTGLEFSYEKTLHGTTGIEQVETNAGGRAVRLLSQTPAIPGKDLELTIDIGLQQKMEAAFAGRRGAIVAIEPASGEILGMVSLPTFNPNLFVEGISVADWTALRDSPEGPMHNRAIDSAYPPGSTFKPFMALAGLESGKRNLEQRFNNQGVFLFADQRFVDRKSNCQNNVNLHRSLVYSCNVYYYQLANDLGIQALADFMRQFGFGQRSDIDIPGEAAGVLPTPEWKRTRFKRRDQQHWYGGETLSIGIGQGYNAYTPLQMASATATLANDGVRYRPHLVKSIINPRTGAREQVTDKPVAHLSLQPKHIDAVRRAMVDVIRGGTAARVFAGAPYSAGGKTGTAQVYSQRGQRYVEGKVKEHLRDHAWFIGFAPAEKPTIALAILVENGGFGAQTAAPIARQIFDYYLVDRFRTDSDEEQSGPDAGSEPEAGAAQP